MYLSSCVISNLNAVNKSVSSLINENIKNDTRLTKAQMDIIVQEFAYVTDTFDKLIKGVFYLNSLTEDFSSIRQIPSAIGVYSHLLERMMECARNNEEFQPDEIQKHSRN